MNSLNAPKREKRRWSLFRFRLRTLLLLAVPVAGVAAWFANELVQSEKEQKIVEATVDRMDERTRRQVGDGLPMTVIYDYQRDENGDRISNARPPAPIWMQRRFGEHLFAEIQEIRVSTEQVNDLSGWEQLAGLECVSIHGASDDKLPVGLENLSQIKELCLARFAELTSLDELAGLESLEKLHISDCDALSDLSGLGGLTNLKFLSIENCSAFTTLDDLSGLTLEGVGLVRCRKVRSLDGISGDKLRHLTVTDCSGLEDVQAVTEMPNLETLYLYCRVDAQLPVQWDEAFFPTKLESAKLTGIALSDLRWLSECKVLTDLLIHRSDSLTSLNGLESCTMLTDLHLRCDNLESLNGLPEDNAVKTASIAGNGITDSRSLSNLTEIETARLSFRLSRIEDIPSSKNLKSLTLSLAPSVETLEGFPECPSLEYLEITPATSLIDVAGIGHLENLQELNICYCESLESIEGLKPLNSLQALQLYNCHALTSLDGLPESDNLVSVQLLNANQLDNVEALKNTSSLLELSLEGAPAIRDCRVFSHLSDLKTLYIDQSENLETLDGLESLSRLETLGIVDCTSLSDLSAVVQLPSLSNISHGNCPKINAEQSAILMQRTSTLRLDDF